MPHKQSDEDIQERQQRGRARPEVCILLHKRRRGAVRERAEADGGGGASELTGPSCFTQYSVSSSTTIRGSEDARSCKYDGSWTASTGEHHCSNAGAHHHGGWISPGSNSSCCFPDDDGWQQPVVPVSSWPRSLCPGKLNQPP